MPLSATPGTTVAATLMLPQQAADVVRWSVTDPNGDVVAEGQQPATGTLVAVTFVMPSDASVSIDGSVYVIIATDGVTSTSDAVTVVGSVDPAYAHDGEIAYVKGRAFTDVLLSDVPLVSAHVTVTHMDGTVLYDADVPTSAERYGDAHVYRMNAGVLDTRPVETFGIGTCTWSVMATGAIEGHDEIHAFWTVTPYAQTMMAAIRKLVDRARSGDANTYLEIKTADLINAVIRGIDYVIESAPMSTPFGLDQTPVSLRDYVIKAGAVDLLRSMYYAEGKSAFDLQNPGASLTVDRTQYIDSLAQQLAGDLQNLPNAKKAWQQQGSPLGAAIVPGVRPVGVLGISIGTYNNYPVGALGGGGAGGLLNVFGFSFLRSYPPLTPSPGDGAPLDLPTESLPPGGNSQVPVQRYPVNGATVLVADHSFSSRPLVRCIDTRGNIVTANAVYGLSRVTLTFASAFTGTVYLYLGNNIPG